jgi:PAS domain S-box-containing protein
MKSVDSHHLLELFSSSFPGLFAYIDLEFKYRYVSAQYSAWFGKDHLSMVGDDVVSVLGARDFAARKPSMEKAVKGQVVQYEGELFHHSLGMRYTEQTIHPDIDASGKVVGIITILYDVTERVIAEREALANEEKFRNLTEAIPQLVWMADGSGQMWYFNENWLLATGSSIADGVGNKWALFIHPDDRAQIFTSWEASVETQKPVDGEFRLRMQDGSYRWHMNRGLPLFDDQGRVSVWVGTMTDIHAQKEIEASQARLVQTIESSSDFIGMSDLHQNMIFLNQAGRDLIGVSGTEFIKVTDFFFEEDKDKVAQEILPSTIRDGSWTGEMRFKHFQTGEAIWMHYNSFVTRDEKSGEITGFATVSRDLTEYKEKEYNLQRALQSRDEFISIASHELKTPLTSLKLQSQMFLRSMEKNDPKATSPERLRAMASQTNEHTVRLNRLIEDMLDVSRIRSGQLRLEKAEYDLAELAQETVDHLMEHMPNARVDLPRLHFDGSIRGSWDKHRLEQVLENLLTNAYRYGLGKPVDIEIEKLDTKALIRIIDHGLGIDQPDLDRIFNRFERAVKASEISGMGLGLFISKNIVEAHGGKIWAESVKGHGSVFNLELPLQ